MEEIAEERPVSPDHKDVSLHWKWFRPAIKSESVQNWFVVISAMLMLGSLFLASRLLPGQPRLRLDSEIVDIGVLDETEKTITVPVHNDGRAELTLRRVFSTCGCVQVTDYDTIIAPKSTGHIQVTVRGSKVGRGERTEKLFIATNDPKQENVAVGIKFQHASSSPIYVAPAAISIEVTRRELDERSGASLQQVVILDTFQNKLKVRSLTSSPNVHAQATDVVHTCENTGEIAHAYRLTVRLLPSLNVGHFEEWVRIETNHPDAEVLTIPVTGTAVSGASLLPKTVSFGIDPGSRDSPVSDARRIVRVRGANVYIEDIDCKLPWLTASAISEDGEPAIVLSLNADGTQEGRSGPSVLSGSVCVSLGEVGSEQLESQKIGVYWIRQEQ